VAEKTIDKRLSISIFKVMKEQEGPDKAKAPQWTALARGVRTLTLRGTATLRIEGESKTGEAEIVAEQHYARVGDEDLPTLYTWKLRMPTALSADRRADVVVDFTTEGGLHLCGVAFLSGFSSAGARYTGERHLHGLAEAGLFPPPPA
jgi:hypothetical protein